MVSIILIVEADHVSGFPASFSAQLSLLLEFPHKWARNNEHF